MYLKTEDFEDFFCTPPKFFTSSYKNRPPVIRAAQRYRRQMTERPIILYENQCSPEDDFEPAYDEEVI